MAKCIHCSWFRELRMAGTIMFSEYWWLLSFARGTGLSLTFTAVVHALHLEGEEGAERERNHLWLVREHERAWSLPPGLWNESVLPDMRACGWEGLESTQVQGNWANQDKVAVTLNHTSRIPRSGKWNQTPLLSVVRKERRGAAQGQGTGLQGDTRHWRPRSSASEKESCQLSGAITGRKIGKPLLTYLWRKLYALSINYSF